MSSVILTNSARSRSDRAAAQFGDADESGNERLPELVQPLEDLQTTVTRQFSLWPFGTRVLKLYLLVDPSVREDPRLLHGLLRAMQQEFFRSEARSQTNALRSALLAAHYVLRDRNQNSLAHDRVTAAAACAVTRGTTAYVALAGEATALAWRGDSLQTHRSAGRVARPLGGEELPRVGFWSAPLGTGERLVLACGAAWKDDSLNRAKQVLASSERDRAQLLLSDLLAGPDGPARVLIAEGFGAGSTRRGVTGATAPVALARAPRYQREAAARSASETPHRVPRQHRRFVDGEMRDGRAAEPRRARPTGRHAALRLAVVPALLALGLFVGSVVLGQPFGEPQHVAWARQAESMIEQAQQTRDWQEARLLAANARQLAEQAAASAPSQLSYSQLVSRADSVLREVDRVYTVSSTVVADLGPAAMNVLDIAVNRNAVFTLNTTDGAVRQFDLARTRQTAQDGTVVLQKGGGVGGGVLDAPVAMSWLPGQQSSLVAGASTAEGALLIVDRARNGVLAAPGERPVRRALPGATEWKRLDAIAGTSSGTVLALDGEAGVLWSYDLRDPGTPTRSEVASVKSAPGIPYRDTVEVLPLRDVALLRSASGQIYRLDLRAGKQLPFEVVMPGSALGAVAAMTGDGRGGAYLAERTSGRIIHLSEDGRFIRQLVSDGSFDPSQLRALQLSSDATRLVGLDSGAIFSVMLPAEIPTPLPSAPGVPVEPASTSVVK